MSKLQSITGQFLKFGLVGVSNTLISLFIYYIFVLFSVKLYVVGSIVGFIVSVLNSYYWNNRYVFKKENRNHFKAIIRTYISYGATGLLSILLLIVLVEQFHISEFAAPIINLAITVPLNFLLNKFWAFK